VLPLECKAVAFARTACLPLISKAEKAKPRKLKGLNPIEGNDSSTSIATGICE